MLDYSEYVKNINEVYGYNCKKKHEFIKKGMGKWTMADDSVPGIICVSFDRSIS